MIIHLLIATNQNVDIRVEWIFINQPTSIKIC